MELWIRTQDRKDLLKVIRFMTNYPISNAIKGITETNTVITLGIYEKEKRELEILDEIQYLLSMPPVHIDNGVEYYMPNDGSSKIYEMPEK